MKLFGAAAMALLLLVTSSCGMSNTGKGALIGTGAGGGVGAAIGALIGGKKGAAIGAGVGAAGGAGAGTLIGHKMDKQKKELEKQLANAASVDTVSVNGLPAIRVTFEGGILFPTNGTTLNNTAKADLSKFATSLLQNPDTDVHIYGFTDNTGSLAVNQRVSTGRADAVQSYLANSGVPASRLEAKGLPMEYYVASNDTPEGRAQNRRVEVYITANDKMIQEAQNGTLK